MTSCTRGLQQPRRMFIHHPHHQQSATPSALAPVDIESEDAEMTNSTDLSAVDEPAYQPKFRAFPVTQTVSGKSRSVSAKWHDRYSWLEYSIKLDALFLPTLPPF